MKHKRMVHGNLQIPYHQQHILHVFGAFVFSFSVKWAAAYTTSLANIKTLRSFIPIRSRLHWLIITVCMASRTKNPKIKRKWLIQFTTGRFWQWKTCKTILSFSFVSFRTIAKGIRVIRSFASLLQYSPGIKIDSQRFWRQSLSKFASSLGTKMHAKKIILNFLCSFCAARYVLSRMCTFLLILCTSWIEKTLWKFQSYLEQMSCSNIVSHWNQNCKKQDTTLIRKLWTQHKTIFLILILLLSAHSNEIWWREFNGFTNFHRSVLHHFCYCRHQVIHAVLNCTGLFLLGHGHSILHFANNASAFDASFPHMEHLYC